MVTDAYAEADYLMRVSKATNINWAPIVPFLKRDAALWQQQFTDLSAAITEVGEQGSACPLHPRFPCVEQVRRRIWELEQENARLRGEEVD